jgi:hypothetical protein
MALAGTLSAESAFASEYLEVRPMTTELNEVEARQADRRKMNMVVLSWGVPAAFVLLAILAAWAWG